MYAALLIFKIIVIFAEGVGFAALVEGGGGSGFRATMLDGLPRPVLSFLGRPVFYLFSPLHTKY